MTLTVVVGSSGSGKTTFLNDTTKSHQCTYIRQFHKIRPYITVQKIPNFDPTQLPYWDIYIQENVHETIKVGGTMAGEFTPGLSGGQRKLLLFELIYQRTKQQQQQDLLLVFDEPFAGVTDDFVPFIVQRLNIMRQQHNILLVTNDHVDVLKHMADNTITVSAIDRSTVQINTLQKVPRDKAIVALSKGHNFVEHNTKADYKFFFDVEIYNNGTLFGIAIFTMVVFALFLASFWGSSIDQGPLLITAAGFLSFFALNPYLLSFVDWRDIMKEEADALLHASKLANNTLKSMLTLILLLILTLMQWGIVNAVVDGFEHRKYFTGMLMENIASMVPFIYFGLYTNLPFHLSDSFATLPYMFMIFFSTTFSPGAGIPGLKALRYLFTRFYFFCIIPVVQDEMEGCPNDDVIILYMVLSALVFVIPFILYEILKALVYSITTKKATEKQNLLKDDEYRSLQIELYEPKTKKDVSLTVKTGTTRKSNISEVHLINEEEDEFI